MAVVIDSSVLLTIFNREAGSEKALEIISHSVMSTVSVAETLGIISSRYNAPIIEAKKFIYQIVGNVITFDDKQAMIAGELENISRQGKYGLSLADKACLALGISMNLPVYTTDKIWSEITFDNLKVIQLR
ncbi:MAG: type II toxin-antitoxin system VapC family toxin [Sphingobacteriia bacterium]|nr:type II toxin-antitoxin system VapC family toxin [Sphingobacteriia bacterium]